MRSLDPTLPLPAPAIAALPLSTPFVAPEELARRAGHAELLRLGANESPFGPPPRAIEAMRAELDRTSWYGDPESMELRVALAARHACGVENITVASGIDDLLGLCVRGYLAPGDVTVATLGSYPTYVYHVAGFGARLEGVPYERDGSIALERLAERARATGARLVYLANPDNPSGSFAPRAAVEALVEALPEGAALVLDEAYADFVEPCELLPAPIDPRVIRLRTFSKAYGLAGARIGYCLAAPSVVQTFQKIRHHYGVNRTAQIGALAALGERRFVEDAIAEIVRGREDYRVLGERLGLATLPSRTNFVCFDLGSRARAEAMVEELLRLGVFVRKPGAAPLDGHIRVAVGSASERGRFALAFAAALQTLEKPELA
ncbi:MAG: aminotransferase class I/II-fold pyridoxal phosphate-dependent enzyme [Vulcanimicrobiaceae bacterium]